MKNNKAVEAIIFDLDGTLIDSLRDLAESVNVVLQGMSLPTHPLDSFRSKVGDGAHKFISRSLPPDRQDLHAQVLDAQQRYYTRNIAVHSRPYPGILEMLTVLKSRSYLLTVLSNKPDKHTCTLVDDLIVSPIEETMISDDCSRNTSQPFFDIVMGHCSGMPLKPDPMVPMKMAEQLGISPEEIAFVGDTSIDMQTARNAGMISIGVTWGFRDREELCDNGARFIVNTPDEIPAILDDFKVC